MFFLVFHPGFLDHKWSYMSTCFQLTPCWQNLSNNISPDTLKSFGNCSALYFGVSYAFRGFLPALPASQAAALTCSNCVGGVQECLWPQLQVFQCMRDPAGIFSSVRNIQPFSKISRFHFYQPILCSRPCLHVQGNQKALPPLLKRGWVECRQESHCTISFIKVLIYKKQ